MKKSRCSLNVLRVCFNNIIRLEIIWANVLWTLEHKHKISNVNWKIEKKNTSKDLIFFVKKEMITKLCKEEQITCNTALHDKGKQTVSLDGNNIVRLINFCTYM